MQKFIPLSLLLLLFSLYACQEAETIADPTPYYDSINIETSSSIIPLNEYGRAVFQSKNEWGDNLTSETDFYVKDEKIEGNIFIPTVVGAYKVKASHEDIMSEEITIHAEKALNKKILIEYYTSRICGWCPWIGSRVDSLHNGKNVIGYSIHGQDQLQIEGAEELQGYQLVYARPTIRLNRGYVRKYATPIEIQPLIDSIKYQLSFQAKAELAIKSSLNQNQVNAEVLAKFHRVSSDSLFLTFILVEDNIVVQNQYNYFSGHPKPDCPYADRPDPIPYYNTHNVVRKFITSSIGQELNMAVSNDGQPSSLGTFQFEIDHDINTQQASLIAILHSRRDDMEISSVINSQIVQLGENIDFEE